jgi:chorismate synthase
MSSSIGRELRYSLFGESHGPALGAVLDGLPAGVAIDESAIAFQMARRKPGSNPLATRRAEADEVEIVSGFKDGMSSGGPLCFLIRNSDSRSGDYDPDIPRPSHADLSEWHKDGGKGDMRGGGRFSGRLTAPLVAAGSVARQILAKRGIRIGAHLLSVGGIQDAPFPDEADASLFERLAAAYLPALDPAAGSAMAARIEEARMAQDSVGGRVELLCLGLPPGIGEPPFDGIENSLSQWIFSVPGVKALEFGAGTGFAAMSGSEANDPIGIAAGRPRPLSNRSGGANGGISNGMPVRLAATLRPTPSISIAQRSVSLSSMSEAELRVKGRHDPCIVPRAVPALESACALCLLDLLIQAEGKGWMA